MRIAVYNTFARSAGGIESYLGQVMPALTQAGHELAMLFELDSPAGHPSLPTPKQAWCIGEIGIAHALRELHAWHPNVIYTNGIADGSIEELLIDAAPSVHFAHDYSATCISGAKSFAFPHSIPCSREFGAQCLLNYFPRRCGGVSPITMLRNYHSRRRRLQNMRGYGAILVASEAMRREYLRNGFRPGQVKLVSYPVSAPPAQSPGGNEPENQQITGLEGRPTKEPLHLLFAGRMVALKGGEVLLNALPRVAVQLGRPLILSLAGDGPARAHWEALARTICAHCPLLNVKFFGWLGVAEMRQVIATADLLVVPSLWPEPFGMIGPEAGIQGVPAAAFAVGGISQWLHEGINGFLAPANPPTAVGLATAVAQCLSDPIRYLELRRGARAQALKFNHAQHIARLLEIFDAVATSPEQRRAREERIFTP